MTRLQRCLPALALFLLLFLPAGAQGLVDVVIEGNELRAGLSLPGGIGADLTIGFEQVVGLTEENVGLSISLADLTDPDLLARLGGLSIPVAFPMLIRIEPPADGGLSFSGVTWISLHTHNLIFVPNTPLRLYAAPLGGRFEDITESVGMGSYRARGCKGSFSEFLILVDLRPLPMAINEKLDRLDRVLDENEDRIDPAVFSQLTTLASQIRSAYSTGKTKLAIEKTEAFLNLVKTNSGAAIPNVWRSSRDLVNVAGLLRSAAATLRFSLTLKSNLLGLL